MRQQGARDRRAARICASSQQRWWPRRQRRSRCQLWRMRRSPRRLLSWCTTTVATCRSPVRQAELLPVDRGPAQDQLLDVDQIGLTLPTSDVIGALAAVGQLPTPTISLPVDLEDLAGDVTARLPAIDLQAIREPVTGLVQSLAQLTGQLQVTASALASAPHDAATRLVSSDPQAPPVQFRLQTTAGSVRQTFTMALCTPSRSTPSRPVSWRRARCHGPGKPRVRTSPASPVTGTSSPSPTPMPTTERGG